MNVRPIRGDELGAFACLSEQEEINKHLAQYLADLWATGTSRPEWCFVTEDAGQISGRVVCWALPTCPVPALIDFLDVPWRGDYWAVGEGLLCETLRHFHRSGAESIKYELILPSWFRAFPEQRTELLTRVGFVLRREGDRWEWTADTTTPPSTTRLTFRPVTEVGEEVLISAVAQPWRGRMIVGSRLIGRDGAPTKPHAGRSRRPKRCATHWAGGNWRTRRITP